MKGVHGSLPSPYEKYDNGEKENADIMAMVFVRGEFYTLVSMGHKQKRKQNDEIIPVRRSEGSVGNKSHRCKKINEWRKHV